jgi:DNA polymerase-1
MNPMPTGKNSTTHKWQQSVAKAARDRWMLTNKNHELYPLMEILDEYQGYSKHVSSFGAEFIAKYTNPVTGKIHTSYKQGTVATGRLASGNVNSDSPKYNSQQIPRNNDIRNCWVVPSDDYLMITCDLSGAELITMCSLAQDHKLLELSKGDMHSYFANKGWEAIHKKRNIPWTEKDIISKSQNVDKRTSYKNMTFGTIYGLKPPKAGELLNVDPKEGKIAINTIVREIPDTINMVTAASAFAVNHGYVVHNTRTNSRRWFSPVLLEKQGIEALSRSNEQMVTGAARNTRIQGTQADMLAEAMVLLDKYIKINKIEAWIVMQVHDELVVIFHKRYQQWFPERVREIMTRSADKYLEGGVHMSADYKVAPHWVK